VAELSLDVGNREDIGREEFRLPGQEPAEDLALGNRLRLKGGNQVRNPGACGEDHPARFIAVPVRDDHDASVHADDNGIEASQNPLSRLPEQRNRVHPLGTGDNRLPCRIRQ
jgi:hypothetical protein